MGGLLSGGKIKTPPYKDLANANLEAGDLIDEAAVSNIDDFTDFIAASDEQYAPWIEAGHQSLADIQAGMASGEFDAGEFVIPKMSDLETDPGYRFRMSEGLKTIRRGAAAGGVAQSGAHTRAAIEHSQGVASQEYDKVYGRAVQRHGMEQERRQGMFNRKAGVAEAGLGATGQSLDNNWRGTLGIAGQRLIGAEAKANAKLGYWNTMVDRQNFKNQKSQRKGSFFGNLLGAAGGAAGWAVGGPAGAVVGSSVGGYAGGAVDQVI